jgi:hypothetical protein
MLVAAPAVPSLCRGAETARRFGEGQIKGTKSSAVGNNMS